MKRFLDSGSMFYVLIALLAITFFLPDLVGPLPSLVLGGLIIGFALYVYNRWCRQSPPNSTSEPEYHPRDEA